MKQLLAPLSALLLLTTAACAAETAEPPTPTGAELLPGEAYHAATDLVWLRCPVGMTWDGADCAGTPSDLAFGDAIDGCSALRSSYRLPSLDELALLLGSCSDESEEARCRPCGDSLECAETLAAEEISEWTWTSDQTGESAFVVEVSRGRIAFQDVSTAGVQARCVRPAL